MMINSDCFAFDIYVGTLMTLNARFNLQCAFRTAHTVSWIGHSRSFKVILMSYWC